MAKKLGRPKRITDEELQKLETAFKMGCNNSEACAYADLAERTFYYYIEQNEDFLQKINKWKKNPILKAKLTIFKNLDDEKTAQWYLERKCKEEFSLKQVVETTNTNISVTDEKIIESVMNKLKDL